jgi:hypothetical protein
MLCHIFAILVLANGEQRTVKLTLPCETPLGVGSVQGILGQLYPSLHAIQGLQIHNDQES